MPTPAQFPPPRRHRIAIAAATAGAVALTALAQEVRAPIESDWGEMDLRLGAYHYVGNVRVQVPGFLNLSCGDLLAQPRKDTNGLESLIATTNVVIEIVRPGRKAGDAPLVIKAYGEKAVYTATNELVTLTGGQPRVVAPQGVMRGNEIIYDLKTGRARAIGHQVTELNPELLKNSGLFRRPTNSTPAAPEPKP